MSHIVRAKGLFALAIGTAASIAALFSHVAIDVAADYVLPHDPYDDEPHASRVSIASVGLALLAGLCFTLLLRAWLASRGDGRPFRAALAASLGPSRRRFLAATNLLVLPLVAAMGALDTLRAGDPIASCADLVGGSIPLAAAIALPIASLCALALRAALVRLSRHSDAILAAMRLVASVFVARGAARSVRPRIARVARARPPRLRVRGNAGKRGPPSSSGSDRLRHPPLAPHA